MPELLTDDLLDLQRQVEALATEVLVLLAAAGADPGRVDTAAVTAASKRAGVFGLTQPSADSGGRATSALALAVAREALGRHDVIHLRGLFGPSAGLLAGVGEPLRSRYLEPLLAGERHGAFAFTEPDSAPRHTWGRRDDDRLIVNGQKSYVTGGGDADFMSVLVEIEGSGPAMVVIDTDAPGVELTRRFGSLDGSHHAAFSFTDVVVPVDHIAGGPGAGMKRAMTQVTEARMAIAAACVGLCACVVDHVADFLLAPHRSGEPLAAVERHRLRYGQLRIAAYAARSTLYRTARLIDRGDPAINEAMAAKVVATETVGQLVDAAIQIVGGEALTDDHSLAGIYRRVRALRLAEGTTDVLRLNVARGHLDLGQGRL